MNRMRKLRINFRSPNVIVEVISPVSNDDLPVTAKLRAELNELSRLHAAAERNCLVSERERWDFLLHYEHVMPMLKDELSTYGDIAEEAFPHAFERRTIKR